ncbi:MAG TPA: hypothetical protein VM553_09055 [Dongiaceae bacterium]|nr:hypothetical protein [Dongiaceae bacterium]
MSINLISGEITAAQMERFDSLVTEMELLLAHILLGLSAEDRRSYGVMGDRTRVFAGHAQSMVHNHRPLFPVSVDGPEFDRDLALFDNAMRMVRRITPFYEKLGDTAMAAGYDAYQHALEVYAFAKVASPNAGVEELVKEMKQLFKRTRKPVAKPETTA